MKTLNTKTLNNAKVKSHLVSLGLISLGFNGEIANEEVTPCLEALSFENHTTNQNGQEFNLVGVSTKENTFIMGFLFMGDKQMEMNQNQFNQAKSQL